MITGIYSIMGSGLYGTDLEVLRNVTDKNNSAAYWRMAGHLQ